MAKVLAKHISKPDLIISSYAKRAVETAGFFAEEFNYDKNDIRIEEQLYMCSPQTILNLLKELGNNTDTVLLFGHNPELTSFCNMINNHSIDNMPTCGMYGMKFEIDKWNEIDFGKGKFEFFEYPKKYIK
jgi:phosphohistidine phosphatase